MKPMTAALSRRSILLSGLATMTVAGVAAQPSPAQASLTPLRATTRTLDVDGRAATVLGLLREDGGHGIELAPNERFRVRLQNTLAEPTIVHWHGQIPPIEQDGVPNAPLPMLAPGTTRDFDFAPLSGTHWMHAHVPHQEMQLLAAPLIVHSADDRRADRQEVVVMLHDFTFTPLPALLAELGKANRDGGNPHAGMAGTAGMAGMAGTAGMAGMAGMAMPPDLNDIEFDAYLANDRTLGDPQVVPVERGGRVLLRVINGAAATVFWIDAGHLRAVLVAVDGKPIQPRSGWRVGLAMGQRADILLEIPREGGAFPILALREGARERAGLILATPGAAIARIPRLGEQPSAAFDTAQETRLQAVRGLATRAADAVLHVTLDGTMSPYVWAIDDQPWGRHKVLKVQSGQRIELIMENRSMMAHPMHLHGHVFQVVQVGDHRFAGAVRDTVHVPAQGRVAIAFDGGERAGWMFHCHHMAHLAAGMMTEMAVS
jgi:FtsP/CotA-like multicopper oxidase with cupredoxin domain